jgi:NADPH-dependent 2,4-dienoyl-CoA reductase/sulfur reductase-like enzyme
VPVACWLDNEPAGPVIGVLSLACAVWNTGSSARCKQEAIAVEEHSYDVVVVGGGAAGLSAALVLGRARRRVAVIDAGAPRNAPAAHMQGFLSRDGMPPADFLAVGRREVTGYGVELVSDQVLGIDPGFLVRLSGGRTRTARRILLATGAGDELPDIPGVRQRWGLDLLHCPNFWSSRREQILLRRVTEQNGAANGYRRSYARSCCPCLSR